MASLAGYSSTPGLDTPGLDTPGLDTPGVETPGQGTPGVQPPSVDPEENTSTVCSSSSSSSSLCSTCMSNAVSCSTSSGSSERRYTPSQGYPGSVNESFDFGCSPPESNALEENEASEQGTAGDPEEQAEEAVPFEAPMEVEGVLLQPVYSDDLEPNYPPFYVSGDEEELLQNGIAQDGESSEWIPLSVENIYPEQGVVEDQGSPVDIDQPLQDVQYHTLPNGPDSQFDQDDSLDLQGLNYSPEQLVLENSPEQLLQDSTPEESVQENSPEQLVQASTPEPSVRGSDGEQFVQDSCPESVQENSPVQLVQVGTPEPSVQDSCGEQFVQGNCPEQLVCDSSVGQLVQDNSAEQSAQNSSPEQSVHDS